MHKVLIDLAITFAVYIGGLVIVFFTGPAIDYLIDKAFNWMVSPTCPPSEYEVMADEKARKNFLNGIFLWPVFLIFISVFFPVVFVYTIIKLSCRKIFRCITRIGFRPVDALKSIDQYWAEVFAKKKISIPNNPPYR